MNPFKTLYCRAFQTVFRAAIPFLPYREPKIIESCQQLDKVLSEENIGSVLIVTDKGIVKNGLTAPVEELLHDVGVPYVLYDGTMPNPTVSNVEEALKLYRDNFCDCLIAIGGGSSMDCAKAVGARVAYPKRTVGQLKGVMRVLRRLPTLIAIPTTAGTGSEVTLAAIITDSEEQYKYALMSFPLIPRYAVLDPALTVSLPPHLTASTGIDALTHAVEAYIGRSTTKETRELALDAVKLIFENVEKAYTNGDDRSARENMLHAAYKAGIAFSKSYVGYVHAVAHSLGGRFGVPHGYANAVILPYVLELYGASVYKKLHELGVAAGECSPNDTDKEGAERFIGAIKSLNGRMGIPQRISGLEIIKGDVKEMSKHAEKEANPLYPVPKLMTRGELEKIYYLVCEGVTDNDRN